VVDAGTTLGRLGGRIRELREARNWSQEELGRRCDRHFTYIGRIERGEQNVTVIVLHQIASALGVPIPALFGDRGGGLPQLWGVDPDDIIEAVAHGFRAQVDVKGKLAELFLHRQLVQLEAAGEIHDVQWLDEDGRPDFIVTYRGKPLVVECKNVRSPSGQRKSHEPIRVELQKTRNPRDGSPTRGYALDHFEVLSACLFNRTGRWEYLHIAGRNLEARDGDSSLLKVMQVVPESPQGHWHGSVIEALEEAVR
jgi:transcriptional regulator with XRE-family HTH domain